MAALTTYNDRPWVRVTLVANTGQAVIRTALDLVDVEVLNVGADDLYVYSTQADADAHLHYLTIAIGGNKTLPLVPTSGALAIWLKSPQAGDALVIWR